MLLCNHKHLRYRPQLTTIIHFQSLQASGPAAGSAASKGDPLYAELEHKGKQNIITPPDMTGVQYSEIKTDEVTHCVDTLCRCKHAYSHVITIASTLQHYYYYDKHMT